MQQTKDELERSKVDLRTVKAANEELREKVGKLERAVLRLKLEKDELADERMVKQKEANAKSLMRQQETHISDLQVKHVYSWTLHEIVSLMVCKPIYSVL